MVCTMIVMIDTYLGMINTTYETNEYHHERAMLSTTITNSMII